MDQYKDDKKHLKIMLDVHDKKFVSDLVDYVLDGEYFDRRQMHNSESWEHARETLTEDISALVQKYRHDIVQ